VNIFIAMKVPREDETLGLAAELLLATVKLIMFISVERMIF